MIKRTAPNALLGNLANRLIDSATRYGVFKESKKGSYMFQLTHTLSHSKETYNVPRTLKSNIVALMDPSLLLLRYLQRKEVWLLVQKAMFQAISNSQVLKES